jgi:hypothetical protein
MAAATGELRQFKGLRSERRRIIGSAELLEITVELTNIKFLSKYRKINDIF